MDNPFGSDGTVKSPFIKKEEEINLNPKLEHSDFIKEPVEVPKVSEVKLVGLPEVKPLPPAKTIKQMILEEYGGLESDVPINSPYWTMKG